MIWLLLLSGSVLGSQLAPDPALVAQGKKIFAQSCTDATCHGTAGAAGKAPQLLGRSIDPQHLGRVIRQGIADTTMLGFQSKLREPELNAVATYVTSLNQAAPQGSAPAAAFTGPPQAKRGYSLFHEASGSAKCGSCHLLAGQGAAVGPDLARLARLAPRGLVTAILASRTQYVVEVKLKAGGSFPAMRVNQDANALELYDLSAAPPAKRTVNRADIGALVDNTAWKHPPESANLTHEQLADIIAYIRYAAYGDRTGVKAADLE
jgi:mono/diheme cytochrome c family protein